MLRDEIERVRESLKAGRFPNEASVSQGVVLRLLHALGWPSYDVDIVRPSTAWKAGGWTLRSATRRASPWSSWR